MEGRHKNDFLKFVCPKCMKTNPKRCEKLFTVKKFKKLFQFKFVFINIGHEICTGIVLQVYHTI